MRLPSTATGSGRGLDGAASGPKPRPAFGRPLALLTALFAILAVLVAGSARAQDADDPDDPIPPIPPPPMPTAPSVPGSGPPADFVGALQTLRAPGSAGAPGTPGRLPEIFPDAGRVWMSVRDTDPIPIETARRGGGWLCAGGQCSLNNGDPGRSRVGDSMLRSIKLQTPTLPLPLTLWGRTVGEGRRRERVLDFDPVLLGRRSYAHVCAYKPTEPLTSDPKAAPKKGDKVLICRDGPPEMPAPDSGEITLGLTWPQASELADFRYLAIVDSCGNARVQPFQRTFTVPVFEVASGGCGQADGKVLRIFPQGGWIRVTAFNLDAPAVGNVMNVTFRVSIPALENMVESSPARLLFPDPLAADLQVDCGPSLRKALPDAQGVPPMRPGPAMVEPETVIPPKDDGEGDKPPPAPPADKPAADKPPPADKPAADKPPPADKPPAADKPAPPKAAPPPPGPRPPEKPSAKRDTFASGAQPLAHQAVVIAPEPLKQGNCRIRLMGQTKRRLVAPLALYVSLTRTDVTRNGAPVELLTDGK